MSLEEPNEAKAERVKPTLENSIFVENWKKTEVYFVSFMLEPSLNSCEKNTL